MSNGFYIKESTVPTKIRKSLKIINKTILCIKAQTLILEELDQEKKTFLTASFTTHNFHNLF